MTDQFLWGAATAPHQTEGNNVASDWWRNEQLIPGMERSGDAVDSYHRYREDMQLLVDAGLNAYRFGIEWARIEPEEGHISRAELAHYRRMIEAAIELGLTPVVTLHHFSVPRWFADDGGWMDERALHRFERYVQTVQPILHDVEWIVTMNEPNMLAMMISLTQAAQQAEPGAGSWQSPTVEGGADAADAPDASSLDHSSFVLPDPDPEIGARLVAIHHAARAILRATTSARIGWSVASQALINVGPEDNPELRRLSWVREDLYLEAARGDDFVGVQSYSTQDVDEHGIVAHVPADDDTMVGTAYRPDALGIAVRHTWEVTHGVPVLVTENGIATDDDARRIAYTGGAIEHLFAAKGDGIDVRGYLHWSALDNFEWGHWGPTFGLIAVDRETFVRTPKPSLAWLGAEAARRSAT
ncbi:glycoside hydrolase family 1 protein [Microbacterium sp. Sa4CUA7]|uniref:Glycoside hydrolase family 1 protein n=1 Tax=Microbacterium pullorum TaxID=2762236 RepID=A0ABR8S2P2_9MICO|nr:family 1 glycosylhydrolase [Microbacterium pullorum]MBD7957747.1 glycoside hydrolase family 1 protein [Microbacterium pullorum]